MTRVLVTGASGFVGRVLCETLSNRGYLVRAALRRDGVLPPGAAEKAIVGNIDSTTSWDAALEDVELVVHAAARAHLFGRDAANPELYFETKARGTQRLAATAASAEVRRFVYVSSVKVNGESTTGQPFTASDEPRPQDAYGSSKWLGEKLVAEVASQTGMQVVVVRSPLVYGPGVRANFLRLLRWVDRGWPLPFGRVHNSRSVVSVWNLCDLLSHVLTHPNASGGTWMVSDGVDLSTPDLIRGIGLAMGRRTRLLPVPVGLLRLLAQCVGRTAEIDRLAGSLALDITQTRHELDWVPPLPVPEALARTARWYLSEVAN